MANSFTALFDSKKMVLVVSLPNNDLEMAKAAVEGGADAIKVHANVEHFASGKAFSSISEQSETLQQIVQTAGVPVGLVPGASTQALGNDLSDFIELGFSFFSIYGHHARAELLSIPDVAKMIAIDSSYTADQLAAVNHLPVDVLEVGIIDHKGYGQLLCVQDLLKYRAIADNVKKPILVPTQRAVKASDVPLLHEAGVSQS
ncbi:hypothetical protein LSG31_16630 [Fodinisporobacter ferrooxydans]|uniref:Uncharacterized protein n=1 Tax=Fodinisporobacter ferrooxydans TaxID=2901836 RepID=A0ABY4CG55_9BACL|nr:hypothetical protein LSG31_16630 [Alicyclobacillaceae bacterium MYW30-H2]